MLRASARALASGMSSAAVCGRTGTYAYVQSEGGVGGLDTSELVGFAVMDPPTEDWSFYKIGWNTISAGITDAADACSANGADTVGAYDEFLRLEKLADYHDSIPPLGALVNVAGIRDPAQEFLGIEGVGGGSLTLEIILVPPVGN